MQESIFFDESCIGWSKDPTLNEAFLRLQEEYIKSMLAHHSYRYSNQIYEVYGAPWDPREQTNNCYLVENGELVFEYDLFSNGVVVITIRQVKTDA